MNFSEQTIANTTNTDNTINTNYLEISDNTINTNHLEISDDYGKVYNDDIYIPILNVKTNYVKTNYVKSINLNNKEIEYMVFKQNEYPIISFYTTNTDKTNTDKTNTDNSNQIYTYHFDTNIIANHFLNPDEITIYKLIILNHYLNKSEQLHLKMGISFDGIFDKLDVGYDSINNKFYVDTNSDNKIYLETKIKQYFEKINDYKLKAKNFNILHIKYKKLQEMLTKNTETYNLELIDFNNLKEQNIVLQNENEKLHILSRKQQLLLEENNNKYIEYKIKYSEEKLELEKLELEKKIKLNTELITNLKNNIIVKTNIIKQLNIKNSNIKLDYDNINYNYIFFRNIFIKCVFVFILLILYLLI